MWTRDELRSRAGVVLLLVISFGLTCGCGGKKEQDHCNNPEYIQVKKDTMVDSFSRNDSYRALEAGLEAFRCDPEDPETNYWLGWIYMNRERKQLDKAKDYFEKALEYKDPYPEVNMAMGMVYLEQNMLDEAIKQFEIAANNDLYRKSFEAFNNLGWIYLLKGDLEKAEQNLKQALKLHPNWCISHCNLGEVYLRKGKTAQGVNSLEKAVQLCPQYARPHLLLGVEYNSQKKIPLACREFNAAINADFKSDEGLKAEEYIKLLNCKRTPEKTQPAP